MPILSKKNLHRSADHRRWLVKNAYLYLHHLLNPKQPGVDTRKWDVGGVVSPSRLGVGHSPLHIQVFLRIFK